MRNRWYDPENGTWLTRDPLHYIDDASLYQYVGSSPLRFVDPLGLAGTPGDWVDKDIEEQFGMGPRGEDVRRGGAHGGSLKERTDDDERNRVVTTSTILATGAISASPAGVAGTGGRSLGVRVLKKGISGVVKGANTAYGWAKSYAEWCAEGYDGLF